MLTNRQTRSSTKLMTVMSIYRHIANGNSNILRQMLLERREIWRFFVDGREQKEGWGLYERREPGYFQAMMRTFGEVFFTPQDLSLDHIKRIHHSATLGVKLETYDMRKSQRGEFRLAPHMRFQISPRVTPDGIRQLLKGNNPRINISVMFFFLANGRLRPALLHINQTSLNKIKLCVQRINDHQTEDFSLLNEYCDPSIDNTEFIFSLKNTPDLFNFMKKLAAIKNESELVDFLYQIARNNYFDCHSLNDIFLTSGAYGIEDKIAYFNQEIEKNIAAYNNKINTINPMIKLKACVEFIQSCEQLHPFNDANIRTFCMILLNELLIKNGFPFAILEDPNWFDCCSTDELVDSVTDGMLNTFDLLEAGHLFEINTNQYYEGLSSAEKKNFDQLITSAAPVNNKSISHAWHQEV